jgi:hypothetical protein
VRSTYLNVQQALPSVPNIEAYLASSQTAVAQLAIKYCSAMVDDPVARAAFYPSLNIAAASTQFSSPAGKDILVVPLLQKILLQKTDGTDLSTQPTDAAVRAELNSLIDKLVANGATSANVAKAACGATLGSGVLSIQ